MNGHYEVVKLLMSDDRVDPSADENFALKYAYHNGHTELTKLLVSDPRVRQLGLPSQNGFVQVFPLMFLNCLIDLTNDDLELRNRYSDVIRKINHAIDIPSCLLEEIINSNQ
ncbi:hypothetical protein ROZALSC1DRAFT_30450 [Rozella allomycis CSF55]|uniref:Ankyrin n=1 Tax=Rozella allomycis (strain CSF55) TaxID=988480 RepID=A0A075AU53_ROZAC|nr:hypothetical protein O9G_004222 [Rozella allomycis CSF55]RKP17784.1 hypothetical protein ROZALSC1DRAFT_30450 [Rozella allomycis CSF55]|eukprot:EPZ32247.1 hypothetical protein O9G_004222 [Rozella allomycis CSF55]